MLGVFFKIFIIEIIIFFITIYIIQKIKFKKMEKRKNKNLEEIMEIINKYKGE